MKIAISVPDDTFDQVERRAAALGMSRSEFFTRAARRYLEELDAHSLTTRIDAAVDLVGVDAGKSSRFAVSAGRRVLATGEDEW
jgi:metal-responsive CopG/Arc/MetJ family transcriptional regulator